MRHRRNERRDHPYRPTRLLQELNERTENNAPGGVGDKLNLSQCQLGRLNEFG